MIELENISKKIGLKEVLQNLSLNISKGKITAICGPNGAGKTTLIRIILNLICKDNGFIKYYVNLDDISFLFHKDCLFPDLTLKENLEFFLASKGMKLDQNKLIKYSTELDLKHEIKKKISTFSQGMIRKADLIRALMENPKLLILDEPTSDLDPIGKVKIREILKKKIKEQDLTIMLTSHLLSEVEKLADYIYIINKGQLYWEGNIQDIKKDNVDLESKFIELINYGVNKNEKYQAIKIS